MKGRKLSKKLTIYSVVGPTASGKTERALKLAKQTSIRRTVKGVNLISVDSRQVYKGLEITTGADVSDEFELAQIDPFPYSFFEHKDSPIRLHGISIIDLMDEWSVNHFISLAEKIIDWSMKNNWAVVLVGGTGLYHRQLRWFLEGKEIVDVPPNEIVRQKASQMSVKQLQDWLNRVDAQKLAGMNQSDRNNARRLVRAIEIGMHDSELRIKSLEFDSPKLKAKTKAETPRLHQLKRSDCGQVNSKLEIRNDTGDFKFDWQVVKVFPDNLEILTEKIRQRVVKRLEQGALDEVKNLLKLNLDPDGQVMTTLGVPEMKQFLENKIGKDELIDLWSLHELQYAKRQLTWWRK